MLCLAFDLLGSFIQLVGGLNTHVHEHARDFILHAVKQLAKQLKGFAFVFLLGLLLRIASQVDALPQVIQGTQMLTPVGIEALQQHHSLE